MFPSGFSEFMSVYSGTKQDGWNEYMLYGGLPLVLRFEKPEAKGNVETCERKLHDFLGICRYG